MYKFSYFTEKDTEKIIAFMRENSFAIITGAGDDYPVATQIPLMIKMDTEGKISLSGHLMKKTDHHKAFLQNNKVLVIFTGPHAYVSASWYSNPQVGGTWNYMTVQAKGKISFTDDAGTFEAIKNITDKYEGKESAAAFANLSQEYLDKMVAAITGFTIEVESIDNVFKLSQNHPEENRQSIMDHLRNRNQWNDVPVANEMEKVKSKETV